MQLCPHCRKENADGEAYCYSCGHILPHAFPADVSTSKLDDLMESLAPQRRWGTAYFDRKNELVLLFRDTDETMILTLDRDVVLGREHNEYGTPQPDVDLTPFGAVEKGVSRMHLKFVREMDTLMVIDLNSSNSTFLNGQRMMPFESRILRDADELRLGHLVIRVMFA